MITPPKKELFSGTVANDGTGDTLRDAAVKINDNFTQLWDDVYNTEVVAPGRKYVCRGITTSVDPDSGQFVLSTYITDPDSDQMFTINGKDLNKKEFKAGIDTSFPTNLSIWELDSGSLDNWTFLEYLSGNVKYKDSNWEFTKTSVLFSHGTIESDGTYYLSLDGVW
jgi:hypothetical protein